MSDTAEKVGIIIGGIFAMFLVAFLLGMFMAWPVMWIWNYLMPDLFGMSEVTYWQAFWGSFLAKLIFPSNTVSYGK